MGGNDLLMCDKNLIRPLVCGRRLAAAYLQKILERNFFQTKVKFNMVGMEDEDEEGGGRTACGFG